MLPNINLVRKLKRSIIYLIQKSIAYPKVLASMLMQSSQILSYRIEKIIMLLVQY